MSKPKITSKTTRAELYGRLSDLEDENVALKALLAHEKAKVKEAPRATIGADDAAVNLRLSEDELWQWCQELCHEADGEDWAVDGLILLLWNVAHQESWIDCQDMADELIERLYSLTSDCGAQKWKYLQALPGKNYRPEEPPAVASLAAAA